MKFEIQVDQNQILVFVHHPGPERDFPGLLDTQEQSLIVLELIALQVIDPGVFVLPMNQNFQHRPLLVLVQEFPLAVLQDHLNFILESFIPHQKDIELERVISFEQKVLETYRYQIILVNILVELVKIQDIYQGLLLVLNIQISPYELLDALFEHYREMNK